MVFIPLILIVAQGFNGGLSLSSLEKLYFSSLVSSYEVVGNDLCKNILTALRFGKSLEKFIGIDPLLMEVKKNLPELHNVLIIDRSGNILYSLNKSLIGKSWRQLVKVEARYDKFVTHDGTYTVKDTEEVSVVLPLKSKKGDWHGSVALSFKKVIIWQKIKAILLHNLFVLAIFTVLAMLFLAFGLFFFMPLKKGVEIQKKRLYLVIITVLIGAQLAYSVFNIRLFQSNYIEISRKNAEKLSMLLKDDIEYLFNKGLNIRKLFKIDLLLSEIIQATPEIHDISILDHNFFILYKADKQGVVTSIKSEPQADKRPLHDYYDILLPLYKPIKGEINGEGTSKQDLEGHIKVHLSRKAIRDKVWDIALDSGTVALMSFLFVIELIILIFYFISRQMEERPSTVAKFTEGSEDYGMMRPVIFIYLLAMALSYSFIPLHMQSLYEPLWGFSKELIIGLPVSMEMFMAGISLIPVGIWMDRRGWHEPFFIGIGLSIAGALLSGVSRNAVDFILARGITGVGYGFTWISSQGFIINFTNRHSRARGFSNLVAGIFAGQICGTAMGAMLAERLSYVPVFFMSAGLLIGLMLCAVPFLWRYCRRPDFDTGFPGSLSLKQLFRFIFDSKVFSVLFLSVVPMSICLVGILFYLGPIYLKNLGSSQSDIGRALIVFGLCVIYLGPVIGKYVDRSQNKKAFIFVSGIIGGISLVVFKFYEGFGAMIFAIGMLGLSSSIGVTAQTVFALSPEVSKSIGSGRALSIHRAVDKLGQMLGPIIIGGVIAAKNIRDGLAVVGLVYMLASFVFVIAAGREKKSP